MGSEGGLNRRGPSFWLNRHLPVYTYGMKQDCPKCIVMLDETGQRLLVKNGRKVVGNFNIAEDRVLSRAIKIR